LDPFYLAVRYGEVEDLAHHRTTAPPSLAARFRLLVKTAAAASMTAAAPCDVTTSQLYASRPPRGPLRRRRAPCNSNSVLRHHEDASTNCAAGAVIATGSACNADEAPIAGLTVILHATAEGRRRPVIRTGAFELQRGSCRQYRRASIANAAKESQLIN